MSDFGHDTQQSDLGMVPSRIPQGRADRTAIVFVVGAFGFIILPNVVRESVVQFRRRGMRGFWRAFRATNWGDGI